MGRRRIGNIIDAKLVRVEDKLHILRMAILMTKDGIILTADGGRRWEKDCSDNGNFNPRLYFRHTKHLCLNKS